MNRKPGINVLLIPDQWRAYAPMAEDFFMDPFPEGIEDLEQAMAQAKYLRSLFRVVEESRANHQNLVGFENLTLGEKTDESMGVYCESDLEDLNIFPEGSVFITNQDNHARVSKLVHATHVVIAIDKVDGEAVALGVVQ